MIKKKKIKTKEKLIKVLSLVFLLPVYICFLIPVPQIFIMKFLEKTKNKEGFLKSFYRVYINNVTGLFNDVFKL